MKLTHVKVSSATKISWFHNLIATWIWKFSYWLFWAVPRRRSKRLLGASSHVCLFKTWIWQTNKDKEHGATEGDIKLSVFGSTSQIWFRIRRKTGEGVESWVQFLSLENHARDEWPKIKCFSMCLNILVPEGFGMPFFPSAKPNQAKPQQINKF